MTSPAEPADDLAIVLLSGGLDSMVSAGLAQESGMRLIALTIDYNQRHRVELDAARTIAQALKVERHIVLPLDLSVFGGSSLTTDMPVRKDGVETGVPTTYVPGRNIIFLSLTLGLAEASGAQRIYIGVNSLDYSGYPDCRPDFIAAFQSMAALGTKAGIDGHAIRIVAPLQYLTKADIAREAARLGIDAGMSWSCYDPTPQGEHCGLCDSCRLRSKGFEEAGLPDPTRYATHP
jgi:7-cyano-7-deazaguanine synthase